MNFLFRPAIFDLIPPPSIPLRSKGYYILYIDVRYALSRSPVLSVPLTGTVVTGPRSPATLNQPPEYPMIITTDLAINNDFSQVPNELILDDSLTDFEFRLWCRLNALR